MDVSTRIGLGGTALFTLAGLGAPIFTWWVSGPIMAVCAVVAGWGFWPLVSSAPLGWPFGRAMVPFHDAARAVYEAAEKAGVIDLMISQSMAPDARLNHFKLLLMVDDSVRLYGAKPPSTKSILIPKDELSGGHELYPADGDVSEIWHLFPHEHPPAYVRVAVPRRDLRRVIKKYLTEYVAQAKEMQRR